MQPIIEKISFYPYSYYPLPKKDMFAITRYNIIYHKWVTLEKRVGIESEIVEYVHELNENVGIITEEFIVGYKE